MTTFDRVDQITILHFLAKFVEECDLEQISEGQACLMIPNILKGKALGYFLTSRNAESCTGLCYWQEYVNVFLSAYATTTAILAEVMQFKDLKQLPRETQVEFSAQVNTIAYCCGNEFSLEDKISTHIFGLQSAIQIIAAPETEEFEDMRGTF